MHFLSNILLVIENKMFVFLKYEFDIKLQSNELKKTRQFLDAKD